MATTTFGPVEEYLRTSYEPDAEYVDGVIEERCLGQYDHGSWQKALVLWFSAHTKEWNIRVMQEYRTRLTPTQYRVPDVTVWDRSLPIEQILTYTPIAVFEVLSPDDRKSRFMVKLAVYEKKGIQTIVVIDPETNTVFRYRDGVLSPNEDPHCPGSVCVLDWTKIRELLD